MTRYADDGASAAFSDKDLSPRARRMAEWLCCLTLTALDAQTRRALGELLLRELPEHWTLAELDAESTRIACAIGPKRPRTAWLSQAGWLVGEQERLPMRPRQTMTEGEQLRARQMLRDLLRTLPGGPRRRLRDPGEEG